MAMDRSRELEPRHMRILGLVTIAAIAIPIMAELLIWAFDGFLDSSFIGFAILIAVQQFAGVFVGICIAAALGITISHFLPRAAAARIVQMRFLLLLSFALIGSVTTAYYYFTAMHMA